MRLLHPRGTSRSWSSSLGCQLATLCRASTTTNPSNRKSQQFRQFVTPPWQTESQSLTASRTLPYPSSALYDIIADVESYSTFLPYCQASRTTKWSAPDTDGRRWPREAEMRVGWGGIEEVVVSKVYCQPRSVLEAVGGEAEKTIPDDVLPLYTSDSTSPDSSRTSVATETSFFKYLFTRWTIRPFPYKPPAQTENPLHGSAKAPAIEKSDVNLKLEFRLTNPVYAAMSKAVAPKIATTMIEAFERRAQALLDADPRSGRSRERREGSLEGVIPGKGMQQTS